MPRAASLLTSRIENHSFSNRTSGPRVRQYPAAPPQRARRAAVTDRRHPNRPRAVDSARLRKECDGRDHARPVVGRRHLLGVDPHDPRDPRTKPRRRRRGPAWHPDPRAPLARRIAAIAERDGQSLPAGQLDITMYRDDLRANPTRTVGRTILPGDLDGRTVVLVDDVLYSGRTVQAALHALADLGRPRAIQLVTLIDRGHRELPIQADIVGRSIPTARSERVRVQLAETDGIDLVTIERSAL
uniref:bifunctional pyr operon transcriptional regulator/uracil phosphoribosyltransferase PyrR n=1 Tax=Tessaracoccus coleopterorum TaxID=2714950 RepID=UPI0038CD6029